MTVLLVATTHSMGLCGCGFKAVMRSLVFHWDAESLSREVVPPGLCKRDRIHWRQCQQPQAVMMSYTSQHKHLVALEKGSIHGSVNCLFPLLRIHCTMEYGSTPYVWMTWWQHGGISTLAYVMAPNIQYYSDPSIQNTLGPERTVLIIRMSSF
jgi:hypothetical protein